MTTGPWWVRNRFTRVSMSRELWLRVQAGAKLEGRSGSRRLADLVQRALDTEASEKPDQQPPASHWAA